MKHQLILLFLLTGMWSCTSNVIEYKSSANAVSSNLFKVEIDEDEVFTEKFEDISYAHFGIKEPVTVELSGSEKIKEYKISPLNLNIKATQADKSLTFRLNKPGYYVVQINNGPYLFLLVDSAEDYALKESKENVINVKDFIVNAPDERLQTKGLQKALDEASGSGKTLYFPAGIYKTGTLAVKSNTTVYLAPGALIKGSENREDYPADGGRMEADHVNRPKGTYSDNGEFMTFSRLLLIDNAHNVKISGKGTIDGSGSIIRSQGKPANLIRIRNSEKVEIDGIVLRDPAAWNTHIQYSKNITIKNVKIINDSEVPNTDGFDPDASRNVLIDHCFAYCSDDNVAIKTTNNMGLNQDIDSITVQNCVFITKKSALKVGTETKAEKMQNIICENNDIVAADRGLVLYCNDGTIMQNISFVNNRFENTSEKGQQRGIHFIIKNRYGQGKIKDVSIKNCIFYKPFTSPSQIFGLDNDHLIENLTIENLVIGGKKVQSVDEANIETNDFVKDIKFQ